MMKLTEAQEQAKGEGMPKGHAAFGRDGGIAVLPVARQGLAMPSDCCPRRAQAAVEVLAYSAFFMLVFVAVVAVFFQQQSQGLTRAENAYAQEIAYGFSDHIHTAFVAGPGFSQKVAIPRLLLGKPYKIALSYGSNPASRETGFVYVEWQGASGNASFSAPTITTAYKPVVSGSFITLHSTFIVIDSAYGQTLCMRNVMQSGANMITIEPVTQCS